MRVLRRQGVAARPQATWPDQAAERGPLADPLVDPDVDGVAGLLADRLPQGGLDGEPVGSVALGHQGAVERRAVDLAADLHETVGAEQPLHVVEHHAGPRAWVVALVELGVELLEHDPLTVARRGTHREATLKPD